MPKAGEFERFDIDPEKAYHAPLDLMKSVPMHHSNLINFAVSGSEVAMTFCTKMDSMVDDEGTGVAIPHVVCFLTLDHAERALAGMLEQLRAVKEEVTSVQ